MKRHPSTKKLADWLETGGPPEVESHVTTCDRCAESMDALAVPVPSMSRALTAVLQPPNEYRERLSERISESLRNRADLALFVDLMGVPLPTAKMLLGDGPARSSDDSIDPR
ncbi:MAG: hypothetical protein V3V01_16095 [Acidimicrobiales bacterium]